MAANDAYAAKRSRLNASITRTHNEAEELVAENEVSRELIGYLQKRALPLHGVLRVQRSLVKHLAPQLWVEKIEVGAGRSRGRNDAAPQVTVDIAAKELNGVDPLQVLVDFSNSFKTDAAMVGVGNVAMVDRKSPDSAKRVGFTVDLGVPESVGKEGN
jgi:hypothetical protein